ncbi:hypothetical protein [Psychrobacillus sp. FSL H8-0487]|uniref:hypothetical protein n=1 Tax=Psychrobacillus sp. FSL H8-0487 TaxID=2921391 RepID=UPI0030FBEAAA
MKLNHLNFHKPTYSYSYKELAERLDTLKSSLDAMEIIKGNILEEMFELHRHYNENTEIQLTEEFIEEKEKIANLMVKPSSAEMIEEIETLKITLNYNLLHYPKVKTNKIELYEMIRKVYVADMQYAILGNAEVKSFYHNEKVFVLIKQHFPNNIVRDLDNQFHSFIFNALRSTKTVSEDNWKKLSYMEEGILSLDGNTKTEIFVCDKTNMVSLLQYLE